MDRSQKSLTNSSTEPETYDVFLCHNSEDKPEIRRIADDLIKQGIKPWLDEREIRPGMIWQSALEEQIAHIKSAAVFIGKSGIGPWQDVEIRAFINEFVERKCPVIPAILSSVETAPPLPILLKNLHYVDFRVADPDPLDQLLWGITGEKPEFLQHDMELVENISLNKSVLYHPLASPPSPDQHAQLRILMNRVDEFWITGVLEQSLFHEVLISLGKKRTDEFVELPWNLITDLPKQGSEPALISERIDQIFDATGLLLILGEPGSGKTTVLLELASHLLERAKNDCRERIPIILNLSSWQNGQPLSTWIQASLYRSYGVPSKLASNWLDKGYLIPLLDGLDEVQIEHQADCVETINAYITDAEPTGLVVCSRLMEYQWLPERLKMNGAICIEPLNPQQIDSYFAAIGQEFESLRMSIKEDIVLQELAQTPLMLNIMSMACRSLSLESLVDQRQSVEARRTQIFAAYIDRMFQRKQSLGQIFPKEKVIAWLSWLAKKMTDHSQSVFFIENLQPNWLDNWRQRTAYRAILSLIVGSIAGMVFGLIFGLFMLVSLLNDELIGAFILLAGYLIGGLIIGLIAGVIFGLIYWLICWLALNGPLNSIKDIETVDNIRVFETVSWLWTSLFKSISAFFLTFALMSALLGRFDDLKRMLSGELTFDQIVNMSLLLTFVLVIAMKSGVTYKIKEDKTIPNQGIILSLKNGLFISFISALIVGFITALIIIMNSESLNEEKLITVLTIGLLGGLTIGVNHGLSTVIKHYALRLALSDSDKIPFKFIPFLDYCAKLILLKKVGGSYIFIHRMLLEYFAKLGIADIKSTKKV